MRTKVQLTYNPFLKEKKANLTINGQEQDKDYLDDNLQSWINQLFLGLKDEWEGCTSFDFEFTGLEVDCQDVREAVEQAKEQGFDIRFTENVVARSSSERLAELEALFAEMKEDPMFKDKISKHNDFKALEENIFDVFVVATMSSGKSTFINAMLGCDLLPTKNEATTAAIAEILHNPNLSQGVFKAARKNSDGEYLDQNVTLDVSKAESADAARTLLSRWNEEIDDKSIELNKRTATIHLEGRLVGINIPTNLKLRLSDTPGTNNSNEINHAEITFKKIKDTQGNNPLIIYLLNGAIPQTTDENQLLVNIAKEIDEKGKLASDRFIFLLSRMDQYFKQNENISKTFENAKGYLRKHKITDPKVYPITARLANLSRIKELNEQLLNEDDNLDLNVLNTKILSQNDRDLTQYMVLNPKQKTYLASIEDSAIKRSGVPAVEMVISDYIEKYNEPYRIMQMTKAMEEIFEENRAEFEQITQLKDKTQEELNELVIKLEIAKEKINKKEEVENEINKLKKSEIMVSNKVSYFCEHKNRKISDLIADYAEYFRNNIELDKAEKKLNELKEILKREISILYVEVEKLNKETQNEQLAALNKSYKEFISDYFDNVFNGIQIELRENFKIQSISLQNYLNLDEKNILTQEFIRKEKIERGFFQKLFSFDFSDHYRYFTEKKKYVSGLGAKLRELDSVLSPYILSFVEQLKQNAINLTQIYCEQLNERFIAVSTKFIQDLELDVQRDDLSQKIEEIEKQLEKLAHLETTLQKNKNIGENCNEKSIY